MSNKKTETLTLISPHGGEPAIFSVHSDAKIADDTNEIIQIIKLLGEDFKDAKTILDAHLAIYPTNDCKSTLILCESFNKWSKTTQLTNLTRPRCSKKLIKYLMSLIYNRAVQEPGKLNQYEAFSPEVYGETGFDIIEKMLARVPLDKSEIFLDLGSGVGNVVLHVAAISDCKVCYGFEKAEWPAKFAKLMEKEFVFWMNFFGKSYSQFKIYKGDFLSDDETCLNDLMQEIPKTTTMNDYVKEIVNDAKIVFVNNYAFGAEVDHQLKLRFCNMTEGSFIISSKAFCPLNFRINSRNLNDIGTMLNLDIFEPLSGHVSWTDKIINYYFQKIDRTLLEKYFEKRNNPSLAIGKEEPHKLHSPTGSASSTGSSYSSSSPSSLSSPNCNTDTDYMSPSHELQRKRKKTHSDSAGSRSPSPSRRHKKKNKKSSSSKKEKLIIKKTESSTSKTKIITKSNEKTLENFHSFTKKTTCKPEVKLLNNQTNKTTKNSSYNSASLASLVNENLNNNNLKDIIKKSPSFVKKLNSFHNSRSLSVNNGSGVKVKKAAAAFNDLDLDEKRLTKELGEDTVNAVENYFSMLKRNYFKYLLHRKSPQFSEKIQDQIKKELDIKRELLKYTHKLETETDSMLKANIDLLKKRTAELGIQDLQYPHEIISFAQEMLADHKKILEKIEKVDKDIKQKKTEPETRNSHSNKKTSHHHTDTSIPPKTQKPPKSSLLNKLLNVIDSKNTENLPAQHKKKTLPAPKLTSQTSQASSYDSQSSEKENLNSAVEIKPSIKKENNNTTPDHLRPPSTAIDPIDIRSPSNSETTTITATERSGIDEDENDDVSSITLDIEVTASGSVSITDEMLNPTTKKPVKCKNNFSNIFNKHSKGVNSSNLKNFKIPKQNSIKSELIITATTTSSTSIIAPLAPQIVDQSLINECPSTQSMTSTTNTSNTSTLDFNNPQKSTNYYHPKKTHFRQYMMESSTICKNEPNLAAPVVVTNDP